MRPDRTILVLAAQGDPHADEVLAHLEGRGSRVFRFCFLEYLRSASNAYRFGTSPENLVLENNTGVCDLKTVHAVWNRRFGTSDPKPSKPVEPKLLAYLQRESREIITTLDLMLPDVFWLSKNTAMENAHHKPPQLALARQIGFRIPETYIGNNLEAAARFIKNHPDICIKPLRDGVIPVRRPWLKQLYYGLRYFPRYVEMWRKEDHENLALDLFYDKWLAYSAKVPAETLLRQIDQIRQCPVILQEYIPKQYELRITVVGKQIFPCAIHSQLSELGQIDWRKDLYINVPHEKVTLPPEVESRCFELIRQQGLDFGCIDMIVTPDNEHVFLENNCNGQWLWIEKRTGMPIAKAIADLLISRDTLLA